MKILDLEMELKKIKDSQLEQPANVDETREEYLGNLTKKKNTFVSLKYVLIFCRGVRQCQPQKNFGIYRSQ